MAATARGGGLRKRCQNTAFGHKCQLGIGLCNTQEHMGDHKIAISSTTIKNDDDDEDNNDESFPQSHLPQKIKVYSSH